MKHCTTTHKDDTLQIVTKPEDRQAFSVAQLFHLLIASQSLLLIQLSLQDHHDAF